MLDTLVFFRGPAEAFTKRPREARVYEWMDGWDGWDEKKRPLIFFILTYTKHYAHLYPNIQLKLSGDVSCGFKNFDKLGV